MQVAIDCHEDYHEDNVLRKLFTREAACELMTFQSPEPSWVEEIIIPVLVAIEQVKPSGRYDTQECTTEYGLFATRMSARRSTHVVASLGTSR